MIENEMEHDEIDIVLQDLVSSGEILAKCPKCDIPLNIKEFFEKKCNSCGVINYSEIKFQNKSHYPSC